MSLFQILVTQAKPNVFVPNFGDSAKPDALADQAEGGS